MRRRSGCLLIAKRSARDTRIMCLNQIRHLGFTGPDELRERLRGVPRRRLAHTAAALRPTASTGVVTHATKLALHTLGRRVLDLDATTERIDHELELLVRASAPGLVALEGVGIDTAAILLVAAGDNPQRLRSEAAFAAPLRCRADRSVLGQDDPASSQPWWDRQANHALWRIVFTRMSSDERTRKYVARRLAEGRSKPEIIRILKRYVARAVYKQLRRA
jgi:transposase